MANLIDRLFNKGEKATHQVTVWLGNASNYSDRGGGKRRFVGLLTQEEIDQAKGSFDKDRGKDNCWGDRAVELFSNRFNQR